MERRPGVTATIVIATIVIAQAIVLVSTDEPYDDNGACLLEEMTQALGLPNDSELVRPSIFNERDVLNRLSLNDQILVRTLYDWRMWPGMPREVALTVAREQRRARHRDRVPR